MKINKCPVCKSPIPMGARSCPICMNKFSRLQLFRMYGLKKAVYLLIFILCLYNAVVIIIENKKIRTYLENPPESIEEIIELEEEYEQLNFIQKYFVHKSEIEYLKKNVQIKTEREVVEEENMAVYFQYGSVEGIYTGEITDGMPNGSGTFTFTDEDGGKCIYNGTFSEARITGKGVMIFEDGKKHEGDFSDGELNGYAQVRNEYGNLTERGQFVNGELHGEGTIYDGNGNKIYAGNFKRGIPEKDEYMDACEQDDIVNISRNAQSSLNKNVRVLGVISEVISGPEQVVYTVYDLVSNYKILVNSREKMANYAVNDKVCIYGYCSNIDEELNSCDIYINSFYIEDIDDIINQ